MLVFIKKAGFANPAFHISMIPITCHSLKSRTLHLILSSPDDL